MLYLNKKTMRIVSEGGFIWTVYAGFVSLLTV